MVTWCFFEQNVLFRSPQEKKLNRNDNEGVYGKMFLAVVIRMCIFIVFYYI